VLDFRGPSTADCAELAGYGIITSDFDVRIVEEDRSCLKTVNSLSQLAVFFASCDPFTFRTKVDLINKHVL